MKKIVLVCISSVMLLNSCTIEEPENSTSTSEPVKISADKTAASDQNGQTKIPPHKAK